MGSSKVMIMSFLLNLSLHFLEAAKATLPWKSDSCHLGLKRLFEKMLVSAVLVLSGIWGPQVRNSPKMRQFLCRFWVVNVSVRVACVWGQTDLIYLKMITPLWPSERWNIKTAVLTAHCNCWVPHFAVQTSGPPAVQRTRLTLVHRRVLKEGRVFFTFFLILSTHMEILNIRMNKIHHFVLNAFKTMMWILTVSSEVMYSSDVESNTTVSGHSYPSSEYFRSEKVRGKIDFILGWWSLQVLKSVDGNWQIVFWAAYPLSLQSYMCNHL